MRRYNIVSGILLILPITDFALAAPVLVQEKCQACVDVVHIPEDVTAVLGKRGGDPLDLLWEKYFQKKWGKPEDSSATHASSSSALAVPDHGSTNVVPAPALNSPSSIVNPDHALMQPSSPSRSPGDPSNLLWEKLQRLGGKPEESSTTHASSSSALSAPDHGSTNVVQAPVPDSPSLTTNPDHALMQPSSPSRSPGDPSNLLWEKFQGLWEESSATHASSSSAPSVPDHGSTNVVQAPVPDSPSSTANPDHALMQPSSPSRSPGDPSNLLWEKFQRLWDESSATHASSSSAPSVPDHGSTNLVKAPGPNPAS